MARQKTLNYYESKVKDVITYIQNNLDKDLNVRILAEKSNISFYHFHRILKAGLGIPLGTYVNHLRLETAAKAIKNTNENISDIATKIGYSDLSAFSKSFAREFGLSPSDYRLCRESSINCHIDLHYDKEAIEKYHLKPKIKIIPSRRVAFIRVKGIYGGAEVDATWQILQHFAMTNRIIGWNPEIFSIYYDDPEVTGAENCVYEICITLRKEVIPSDPVKIKEVDGGKYLVFRYKGPYEKLWEVYDYLFKNHLLLLEEHTLRDAPMHERYVRYSERTRPENLITDIYIPIN
jgi:AraC family transcriptional regulator